MTDKAEALNIYLMYVRNGNRCGFWVKRNSWLRNIARVTNIAGKWEGLLEGNPPYFTNPKVRGDIYEEATGEMRWASGGSSKNQELTSPGTYGYHLIPTPSWWRETE
jgi:hypothetical protein